MQYHKVLPAFKFFQPGNFKLKTVARFNDGLTYCYFIFNEPNSLA